MSLNWLFLRSKRRRLRRRRRRLLHRYYYYYKFTMTGSNCSHQCRCSSRPLRRCQKITFFGKEASKQALDTEQPSFCLSGSFNRVVYPYISLLLPVLLENHQLRCCIRKKASSPSTELTCGMNSFALPAFHIQLPPSLSLPLTIFISQYVCIYAGKPTPAAAAA